MEVGRISARLDAIFDDAGFDKFDRRVRAARTDSKREIKQKLDTDYNGKGFDRFKKDSDGAEKSHSRLIGVASKSGLALRAAGTGAAAGAVGFGILGKAAIGTASDINESLTKNQVLFGKYAKGIDNFSKTSATSLGISRSAALEATGVFGNLFTALDIAPKKSADMSKGLVKLAADMASFNNASPEETLEAIRSGLVGETEPLRKYGVNINDAALKHEALRMGLIKDTKETLPAQAKALAANALITKQTAAAHGDFARTSGGLANQTRIMKARLSDVSAELGAKLLPAAVKVVGAVNKVIDVFQGGGKESGKFGKALDTVRGIVHKVGDVFKSVFGFVKTVLKDNRDNINAFQKNVTTMVSVVRSILKRVVDAFQDTFGGNSGTTKSIRQIIKALGTIIVAAQGVLVWLLRQFAPGIGQMFKGLFTMIRGAIRLISGILTGDFGKAWKGVKDIFGGAVKSILGIFKSATAPFRTAAKKIGDSIADPLSRAWQGIKRNGVEFVNGLIGILNKIPGVDIKKLGQVTDQGGTGSSPGKRQQGQPQTLAEGGKVTQPIVIMGEEAPTHPEWVIPTNPSYRGRAVALWAAAGREIGVPGFRQGGLFSQKEMEQLWAKHGGGDVKIAGAVGMAESGGDPNAGASHPYHGLWQIGPGGPFDPDLNAIAGIRKWRASGWKPWEAYTGSDGIGSDGPFRKFMGGAGFLGSAWDAAKGAAGDLAGDLLGKLPKLPNVPDWVKPAFTNALDKAKDFIKDKAGDVGSALGLGGGGGSMKGTLKLAQRVADFAGLRIGSSYRSPGHNAAVGGVPNSLHTHGSPSNPGAVDLNGPVPNLYKGLAWAKSHLNTKEAMVHDVGSGLHLHLGFFRKGGKTKGRTAKPILSKADTKGISRSLRRKERGLPKFETRIQDLERDYGQLDRRFGLSEEDWLIEHDDGSVTIDTAQQGARMKELDALIKKRDQIRKTINKYRTAIQRLMAKLRETINTLQNAMKAARGKARKKERAGYKQAIGDHKARLTELGGVFKDLSEDQQDAGIDLEELRGERATVSGAKGAAATPEEKSADDTSPDLQALLDQATANSTALAADLATARQNLAVFSSPGDIGTGTYANAFAAASDTSRIGANAIPTAPASGGNPQGGVMGSDLTVEIHSFVPPTGAEAARLGRAVVSGLEASTSRRGDIRDKVP